MEVNMFQIGFKTSVSLSEVLFALFLPSDYRMLTHVV